MKLIKEDYSLIGLNQQIKNLRPFLFINGVRELIILKMFGIIHKANA